jgi:glycosyltransferase involved in cell wall biosynthesis
MNIGGGETMAVRLASYIDREKFDIKIFILGEKKDNQISYALEKSQIPYECLGIHTNFHMKDYFVFSRAMKKFQPDVIHAHLDFCYSWLWTTIHHIPLLVTIHGDPHTVKNKKAKAVISLRAKQRKLRVVGCAQIMTDMSKEYFGLKKSQMGTIYNPINLEDYTPVKKVLNKNDMVSFLHIGRFSRVKNHRMLISAFSNVEKQYDNAKLYLAGSGDLFEEMKAYANELECEKIHFLGNVQNIPELLSKMDVLLLSSLSEACPMVILEAMAAGLPIIATRVGGVPELITDNGILVDNDDADAFSKEIGNMIENPEMLKLMSERSLEYSTKYDKSNIARQYENEYTILANKRKNK